jgi:multidrug transporter EmrE-like cation transporter
MVTAFYLIKYVGRIKYNSEVGKLMNIVKQDDEYRKLLVYFTGIGASKDKYTLLAFAIRYLPTRVAYNIISSYYKFATRDKEE